MANIEIPKSAAHESGGGRVDRRRFKMGGSGAEALLGLIALVISILALAGLAMVPFAAIAVILVGAALIFDSASVAAEPGVRGREARAAIFGGVGADTIAGLAAITLGILSLVGIDPFTLLPVAILVVGAGLLFSGAMTTIERMRGAFETTEHGMTEDAQSAASGVHMLVGAAGLVLGILGVVGPAPIMVTLVSTLSIGAGLMLNGLAMSGRVFRPLAAHQ